MGTCLFTNEKFKLLVSDLERGGETLFQIPSDFMDKVTCFFYCKERNVIFVGAKDGKFRVWKVPKEWRNKDIDKIEREFEFSRKQMIKMKSVIKKGGSQLNLKSS